MYDSIASEQNTSLFPCSNLPLSPNPPTHLFPQDTFTHLDSLAHMFWDGFTYNGYNASQTVNLRQGASLLDVVAAAPGIVGRGVLLDAAEVGFGRGGSGNVDEKTGLVERWMEPGEFVTGEDLEAIAKKQGVEVRAGDLSGCPSLRDPTIFLLPFSS